MADLDIMYVPASFQFIPNSFQNNGGQAVSGLSAAGLPPGTGKAKWLEASMNLC